MTEAKNEASLSLDRLIEMLKELSKPKSKPKRQAQRLKRIQQFRKGRESK